MSRSELSGAERDELKSLFEAALALAPENRAAFVEREGTGARVRDELAVLVGVIQKSAEYFDELSAELLSPALHAVAARDMVEDFPPGTVVSHYEIIERIGSGGMGVVYKARDTTLGRTVALKFLSESHDASPATRTHLLAEARAASTLDHPNVGVVHEIAETDDGRQFISMAWYDGETVKDIMRRGPLPVVRVVEIAIETAAALAAAHAAGIIHRDVKPANVIVTRSGIAKLVDFGIARITTATASGDTPVQGTPAYMSPEQVRREIPDARTDIWSLGVMMFEMFAGSRPFHSGKEALMSSILSEEPESLRTLRPDLPGGIVDIVERCLAKNADERFRNAADIVSALRGGGSRIGSATSSLPPTRDNEAYELYLKGRHSWGQRTRPAIEKALAYYRGAIERDPRFALAHSGLAEAYINMSNFEFMPSEQAIAHAGVAADRAITLDNSLAEAHSSRGFVLATIGKFVEAEQSFEKAIELNPDYSWAHHYYALLLIMLRRIDEAIAQINECLALDPLSLPASTTLAILYSVQGSTDRAREQYRHTLSLAPGFSLVRYYHGAFEAGEGNHKEAIESLDFAIEQAPGFPGVRASLAFACRASGDTGKADRLIAELEAGVNTERTRINLGLGYGVIGKLDASYETLRNARWDVPTTIELRVNTLLADFRSDPRYASLLKHAGLDP